MGQTSSRHRPEQPLSSPHPLSSAHSSSTRIADDSSLSRSQRLPNLPLHASHHNSDLPHQGPLPAKRSRRRSLLGTLRSPLRNRSSPQRTPSDQDDVDRASNAHKWWTLDSCHHRRKTSEPARRTLSNHPELDESQLGEPSCSRITSTPSPPLSNTTTATAADTKGKAKEANPTLSVTDLPSTVAIGPSSSDSSTIDVSQPNSNYEPFQSTATGISSSSAASPPPSASSSSPARDPLALNHDPRPPPSPSFEPDDTPDRSRESSEAFNVMERPATPPDLSQAPPLPAEARRNFPAAGTLVVVQGVVHTSDVSPSGGSESIETAPRRASSVPPPGERPSRRRFSDLLTRPMRSRRSSYAAPESQSSESSASTESENQDESSPTGESSQPSPSQEEPPVPASRPLSLSPTSIEVLGTLLSVATAATAASLVSGSSEPLLNSGLGLPSSPGVPSSQQQQLPPSPVADQGQGQGQNSAQQGQSQTQSRPLSPTPTAGLASRDRMRNAWAGLRDRLGFRPSSPTNSPVSPSVGSSPSPESEPAPSPSPVTPIDPRTQLLADMTRAFQMGMGLEDGSGSGSRSGAQSPPAIEVNLGDGEQQQEQQERQQQHQQQQQRSPPPEDSFDRFLMDLQVDLRRTLEDGQPETETESGAEQREREAEPVGMEEDAPPLIYPREAPLSLSSTDGRHQSVAEALDFSSEHLPALPPDDDDLLPYHDEEADGNNVLPDIGVDIDGRRLEEEETVTALSPPTGPSPRLPPPPPSSSHQTTPSMPTLQSPTQTRRTVAGSERRPVVESIGGVCIASHRWSFRTGHHRTRPRLRLRPLAGVPLTTTDHSVTCICGRGCGRA
ncbi:hypothetical protein BJV74DRAFT_138951 [Russula compacta]|nr:hypothetical protein BJV74DRAFT_138951 [Russula compacta]